jgi:hypothetical protein
MAGTMRHPMGADPADLVAAFREYAADSYWVASHLAQFVGLALGFVGLVALADTLRDATTGWLARLGVYLAVAALSATAILQAVDGVALKVMVDGWANAPVDQKQSSYLAALAVRQIEIGVAAYMSILFGAAIVLLGSAMVVNPRYRNWLGWFGVTGGIGTIAGGVLTAFTGFSTATMDISIPFGLIVVTWMVMIGVVMWKQG